MPPVPILQIRDVTRRFPGHVAVDRVSFTLNAGRIAALLGPSGCGKSTLLRMIAGLEPIDEGEIGIRGQAVSSPAHAIAPQRRGVGLVFQDNALFPHLDVRGNIAFGIGHLPTPERQARVDGMLTRFHVEHLAHAWPHMLSGGEQQRVAIARALAREPSLLLLDEPFSGLDGGLRERVRQSLIDDLRDAGATVLVVTHDPDEAMMIADDLVLMDAGRVLQVGSTRHCYGEPVSAAAARLLGDAVVLPATVSHGAAATPLGTFCASGLADGPAHLIARPHALTIARRGAPATVIAVRFLGHAFQVEILIDGHRAALRADGDPPAVGDQLFLVLPPQAARIVPVAA